jgi:hypothetical protein
MSDYEKWMQEIEEQYPTASDAEKWRLLQANEMLHLFEEDTGHPPTSMEELEAWVASSRGQAILGLKGRFVKKRHQ